MPHSLTCEIRLIVSDKDWRDFASWLFRSNLLVVNKVEDLLNLHGDPLSGELSTLSNRFLGVSISEFKISTNNAPFGPVLNEKIVENKVII